MHKKYFISILLIPALLVSMESEYTPFLQTQDSSCNEVVIDLSQSGDDFINLLRPYDKKNFNQLPVEDAAQRSLPPELVAEIVAFKLGQCEENTQKAKKLINAIHRDLFSGSFINTIEDLLCNSSHKEFYNLVNDGTSLPDKIYLDLITSYDKHECYPHSFKKLLAILPQRVRDKALCTASPDLIDLLMQHGDPDIDGAIQYIEDIEEEFNNAKGVGFARERKLKELRERMPDLLLHKPGLSWKQKWHLWNKTKQSTDIKIISFSMCMLTSIMGTAIGLTLLLS